MNRADIIDFGFDLNEIIEEERKALEHGSTGVVPVPIPDDRDICFNDETKEFHTLETMKTIRSEYSEVYNRTAYSAHMEYGMMEPTTSYHQSICGNSDDFKPAPEPVYQQCEQPLDQDSVKVEASEQRSEQLASLRLLDHQMPQSSSLEAQDSPVSQSSEESARERRLKRNRRVAYTKASVVEEDLSALLEMSEEELDLALRDIPEIDVSGCHRLDIPMFEKALRLSQDENPMFDEFIFIGIKTCPHRRATEDQLFEYILSNYQLRIPIRTAYFKFVEALDRMVSRKIIIGPTKKGLKGVFTLISDESLDKNQFNGYWLRLDEMSELQQASSSTSSKSVVSKKKKSRK